MIDVDAGSFATSRHVMVKRLALIKCLSSFGFASGAHAQVSLARLVALRVITLLTDAHSLAEFKLLPQTSNDSCNR